MASPQQQQQQNQQQATPAREPELAYPGVAILVEGLLFIHRQHVEYLWRQGINDRYQELEVLRRKAENDEKWLEAKALQEEISMRREYRQMMELEKLRHQNKLEIIGTIAKWVVWVLFLLFCALVYWSFIKPMIEYGIEVYQAGRRERLGLCQCRIGN